MTKTLLIAFVICLLPSSHAGAEDHTDDVPNTVRPIKRYKAPVAKAEPAEPSLKALEELTQQLERDQAAYSDILKRLNEQLQNQAQNAQQPLPLFFPPSYAPQQEEIPAPPPQQPPVSPYFGFDQQREEKNKIAVLLADGVDEKNIVLYYEYGRLREIALHLSRVKNPERKTLIAALAKAVEEKNARLAKEREAAGARGAMLENLRLLQSMHNRDLATELQNVVMEREFTWPTQDGPLTKRWVPRGGPPQSNGMLGGFAKTTSGYWSEYRPRVKINPEKFTPEQKTQYERATKLADEFRTEVLNGLNGTLKK